MLTSGRSSIDGTCVDLERRRDDDGAANLGAMFAGPRRHRAADAQPEHHDRIAEPAGDVDRVVRGAAQLGGREARQLAHILAALGVMRKSRNEHVVAGARTANRPARRTAAANSVKP